MTEPGPHPEGATIAVRARPNARKDAILGERAGALCVGVSAAPERGKANAAIAKVLADAFECRSSAVRLLAGETSRDKRFLIVGVAPDELARRIRLLIETTRDRTV